MIVGMKSSVFVFIFFVQCIYDFVHIYIAEISVYCSCFTCLQYFKEVTVAWNRGSADFVLVCQH